MKNIISLKLFKMRCNNNNNNNNKIGIKHDFLCISICWAPREVLNPEPERRGLQHLPRGPVDVSEKPVWSLLFHKNILLLENWRKCFQKFFFFSCTYNGAKRLISCERFENAASRAKTNVILKSRNYARYCARYWWWRQFLWRPRNTYS